MKYESLLFGSLITLQSFCCSADPTGRLQPLVASVQRAGASIEHPDYVAIVNAGTNQFTFSMPEGYRFAGEPAEGKLQMINYEFGAWVTFRVLAPESEAAVNQTSLLARYNAGRVVEKFDRPVLGTACHVTDIEWSNGRKMAEKTRVIYAPSSAGMVEITFTCGAQDFGRGAVQMNWFLNSLRLNSRERRELVRLQRFN
ncbi:MAG TPA: hypothetical protein VFB72_07180 [Verrucomicrobiae bacterium]|nr:hypothetical protein [Verrucomicrobiae bacterium]